MPIQNETVNMTFNFKYVSEDQGTAYFVRFHHIEGQPVVSLSEDEETWHILPASLFTDVTDFLRNQKVVGNQKPAAPQRRPSALPGVSTKLPNAGRTLPLPSSGESIEDVLDNDEGLETLSGLDELESIVAPSTGTNVLEDEQYIARPVKRSGGPNAPTNEEKAIRRA